MFARLASRRWAGPGLAAISGVVLFTTGSMAWMWVLGVLLTLAALAWGGWDAWRAARHGDEAREFAATHGWEYVPRTYEYNSRFWAYPFSEGEARRQESVLRGTYDGQRCATFSHVFETRSDKDSAPVTHAFQVTLAELPVALPRIDIVPQNAYQQVLKALGGRDVEVESHAFNERWRVRANDARYAHAVLDPRMVERLTWLDVEGASIRIEGAAVYVWGSGRRGTEDLAKRLGIVTAVARRVPAHVIREYRELGYGTAEPGAPLKGPDWATQGGVLNSRRYTGIGVEDTDPPRRHPTPEAEA